MSRPISERIARLKRLRRRMTKDVSLLDEEIVGLEADLRATGFKPRREMARPNASRINDMTVGDAAERVLRRARRPMRLSEILEAIERRGLYKTKSTHFKSTVAQALARDKRFRKVRRGVYRLVE